MAKITKYLTIKLRQLHKLHHTGNIEWLRDLVTAAGIRKSIIPFYSSIQGIPVAYIRHFVLVPDDLCCEVAVPRSGFDLSPASVDQGCTLIMWFSHIHWDQEDHIYQKLDYLSIVKLVFNFMTLNMQVAVLYFLNEHLTYISICSCTREVNELEACFCTNFNHKYPQMRYSHAGLRDNHLEVTQDRHLSSTGPVAFVGACNTF